VADINFRSVPGTGGGRPSVLGSIGHQSPDFKTHRGEEAVNDSRRSRLFLFGAPDRAHRHSESKP
jgi:hypothetical protein